MPSVGSPGGGGSRPWVLSTDSLRPVPVPLPGSPPCNHLFSYSHQQPNYWSFKVSARCFCLCDDCMSCPPLPPLPCTRFALGCASARDPLLFGRWAWGCRLLLGGVGRVWVCLPGAYGSRVGVLPRPLEVWPIDAQIPSSPKPVRGISG